ncbi:hypothetical protein IAU60_004300 [Kwoniella sp. DSM 27419]
MTETQAQQTPRYWHVVDQAPSDASTEHATPHTPDRSESQDADPALYLPSPFNHDFSAQELGSDSPSSNDLYSSMSKAPNHQHSASYTYGTSDAQPYASGLSQERSTASSTNLQSANLWSQYPWHARLASSAANSPEGPHRENRVSSLQSPLDSQVQYTSTSTRPYIQPQYAESTPANMLPPLRLAQDARLHMPFSPAALPVHGQTAPFALSGYQAALPPFTLHARAQSLTYTGGHVSQPSTSSSTSSSLWTPQSATSGSYTQHTYQSLGDSNSQPHTPGAAQPLGFPSWSGSARASNGTISPLGMLAESQSHRLVAVAEDRRSSTPGGQEINGDVWGRSGQSALDLSPGSDPRSIEDEEVDVDRPLNIIYITDCEIKQTAEVKRMCFNCGTKSPPSWRKSILHIGKILCNKCGIFERTHHRPRPAQNDDQKLRKQSGPAQAHPLNISPAYRRDVTGGLQVMKDDSDGSPQPLDSPFSNVPSQSTPASSFSTPLQYPSSGQGLLSSGALNRRRTAQIYNHQPQSSPIHPAIVLATPPLSSSTSSYSTEVETGRGFPTPSHSHHGYGSSPYAHAYANRRTYSTHLRMTSPITPFAHGLYSQLQSTNLGGLNTLSAGTGAAGASGSGGSLLGSPLQTPSHNQHNFQGMAAWTHARRQSDNPQSSGYTTASAEPVYHSISAASSLSDISVAGLTQTTGDGTTSLEQADGGD